MMKESFSFQEKGIRRTLERTKKIHFNQRINKREGRLSYPGEAKERSKGEKQRREVKERSKREK